MKNILSASIARARVRQVAVSGYGEPRFRKSRTLDELVEEAQREYPETIAAMEPRHRYPAGGHVTAIADRVAKGIEWLTAHDETGAFHLWFTAGVLPQTPMPAQSEEVIERYREYWKARTTWEQLWRAMEAEERRAAKGTPA